MTKLRLLSAQMAKAVAAHHSQAQHRARGGRFVAFHHGRTAPRNAAGRFAALLPPAEREAARALADDYRAAMVSRLGRHLADVRAGRLDADTASARGREDIAEYYALLYREGRRAAGNPNVRLSPQDVAAIGRAAADEGDYFAGFMRDVAAGEGVWDYGRRLQAYGQAGNHPFWLGFALSSANPRRRISWITGPTEHCPTCKGMAARGPMTVAEFVREAVAHGYLPQSGDLECKGLACKCSLKDGYERAGGRA